MQYSPSRVRYLVLRYRELLTAAESPETARHLFAPGHDDRPCEPEPRTGKPRKRPLVDRLRYADLVADLQSAWQALPVGSLERHVVTLRMQGINLERQRRLLRCDKRRVVDAYRTATEQMATTLGWTATQAA